MNILYTNFHPGNGGGHTTYLSYLFDGVLSQGINAFIAAPKVSKLNKDLKQNHPNKVFDLDFPGKPKEIVNIIRNIKKLKNIITKKQIDIVHVNGTPDHKVVMLCKWFYKLNFRIIRTKHDSFKIKQNWFSNKLYSKYTDQMIVVSSFQYDHIITGELQKKTTIIHNGIDLDYFQPREKSKDLIKQLNIQDKDIVFVSVAGTALHKGWQFLVEATSRLDDELRSRVKIVIVGNLPKNEIVEQYINRINMQDNVVFTGFINDVREVISIADVGFVLSPQYEALSIACREMMSMGKPVLISNVGGLPENINNNQNGWIVEQGSIDQIQEFLQRAKELDLCEFSNSAIQKAKKEFGLDNFIQATLDAYSY
ncbi:MAG TPA: glycosyltransferase family 1 protein [Candidatus Thioglobus sp.]|nr:glycosyltransferase family 1 protein [Candidatus Thioglobus sp.]